MSGMLKDRLVVGNDTKDLLRVRDFIAHLIGQSRLRREEENKVILAVDEAVTNIIEHGYGRGAPGTIEVEVEAGPDQFRIMIRDTAPVFNPASVESPNVPDHISKGCKKGLGIFLMRQIMDEVRYAFKDGVKNELTLVKYIR